MHVLKKDVLLLGKDFKFFLMGYAQAEPMRKNLKSFPFKVVLS
jgi:hypothetical protein